MKPVNKACTKTCHHLQLFSSQIWDGSFGKMENSLTEDIIPTAHKYQIQDRNSGLVLPVIVLEAVRGAGPQRSAPTFPEPSARQGEKPTGSDFHARRDGGMSHMPEV